MSKKGKIILANRLQLSNKQIKAARRTSKDSQAQKINEPSMNNKQIQKEVLNDKRKQYESKILQFMGKTQESSIARQEQRASKASNKREKIATHRSTQQSMDYNDEKQSRKREEEGKKGKQEQQKNPSTHRYKKLNRKATLVNSSITQQQPPHVLAHNHQHLLQKIQSRIHQMNQKISQQISNSQTSLMDEYQSRLKLKLQELNQLRQVTNQQMINEKTVERKEQLRREKENLIEGNHYYGQKLEELKKEYGRLTQIRDNQRRTLQVLMMDEGVQYEGINNSNGNRDQVNQSLKTSKTFSPSGSHRPNKKKPVYFSSQDYVQKVLKKYNQKSQIISQSRLQQSIESQKDLHPAIQPHKKHQSLLPRISQKRQATKSKSINPEEEYYSYRKVRRFDRAKSTGVFDSMGLSIDGSRGVGDGSVGEEVGNRLGDLFRYNNKKNTIINSNANKNPKATSTSTINNQKSTTVNVTNPNHNNLQQPKPLTQPITTTHIPSHQPQLHYTKQYLEQFVVKKTTKQQAPKTSPKQKSSSERMSELMEKEQLMREQLEPELRVEELFRMAAEEYYRFKQRQRGGGSGGRGGEGVGGNEEHEEQHQNDEKAKEINKMKNKQPNSLTPIDKKRAQSLLQMKEFDKKIIMDLLLNHYNFKKYLYQLIVGEFEPKFNNSSDINLQQIVKNFQHNTIYSDSRNV